MGKELPLAECAFGWGRLFRLYSDYLEVKGIPYALSALTRLRPTFRTMLGIPSARLELWFGKKKVVLRGIAAIDDARAVSEYLSSWCQQEISLDALEQPIWPGSAVQEKRDGKWSGESLPSIPVPVRLLPGEQAYYSTVATLCGEPIAAGSRVTYPARDQGTLILTNRRMIYIGRTSQVVIDYAHLLRISHLQDAIAVQTDYRRRREIFELRKPEECAQYLETILARSGDDSKVYCPTPDGEGVLVPEKEEWATEEISADCSNETLLVEDEVEIDGLTRRSWRMERIRMRLRDTEDFQERWQEPGTTVMEAVEGTGSMGNVESMGSVGSALDMMPDSVADALRREVGGNE